MPRRKNGAVTTRVASEGVRKRLGRPVKDATEGLVMPLTKKDIERAIKARNGYDVNDPENFYLCALAQCIGKISGAEVAIMRKHAFIALPGEEHTLRFAVDPATTEIIHLNDEERFDEIPPNINIKLRPPTPSNRLTSQRARQKAHAQYKSTRGSGRKQRPVDPMEGVWRNGLFATEA